MKFYSQITTVALFYDFLEHFEFVIPLLHITAQNQIPCVFLNTQGKQGKQVLKYLAKLQE